MKSMYVPHYDALLHAIGTSRKELDGHTQVEIPISLFKYLLQLAVTHGDFNLAGYLAGNKDIQDAAKRGQVPDPKSHYVSFGFFEGRRGATPSVDENWYRRTYSDVAAAIRKGEITSAQQHFLTIGAEEFRAPSAAHFPDATEWKKVCGTAG
jgi:hypothetical protein